MRIERRELKEGKKLKKCLVQDPERIIFWNDQNVLPEEMTNKDIRVFRLIDSQPREVTEP